MERTSGQAEIVPIETRIAWCQKGSQHCSPRISASTPNAVLMRTIEPEVFGVVGFRADGERQTILLCQYVVESGLVRWPQAITPE